MSRSSSRRRNATPIFPTLSPGIQAGLQRLVSDHVSIVAAMLNDSSSSSSADNDDETGQVIQNLCEQCAKVMKQQQLSPSSFLARFFDATILSQHAVEVLQKSGKGSAPTLAERIVGEWSKNKDLLPTPKEEGEESASSASVVVKETKTITKKKESTKKRKNVNKVEDTTTTSAAAAAAAAAAATATGDDDGSNMAGKKQDDITELVDDIPSGIPRKTKKKKSVSEGDDN